MKINSLTLLFILTVASAQAAGVDSNNPSAIGTDQGIRVEAHLVRDTIAPGATIGISYQVQNLTPAPIAIAEKVCSAAYDRAARTVVVSIGSEIPDGTAIRRLVIIPSGAQKSFTAGAPLHLANPGSAEFASTPRYVQIRVSVLRGWSPPIGNEELFEKWLDSNLTILLNALPIHYVGRDRFDRPTAAEFQARSES